MQLTTHKILTFDCYGTLIDWESGILAALQPLVAQGELEFSDNQLLEFYGMEERLLQEEQPALRYDLLLAEVHRRLARQWRVTTLDEDDHIRFGNSLPYWPAFADSAGALRYLKRHFKLMILSNTYRAGFAHSNRRLGVEFDSILTAEDVGTYKPAAENFNRMLGAVEAMGLSQGDILHTAESLHHDHVPAGRLGLTRAWINRRMDRDGLGATGVEGSEVTPEYTFATLGEMADAVARELGETR